VIERAALLSDPHRRCCRIGSHGGCLPGRDPRVK
jgi:hypothetical protein